MTLGNTAKWAVASLAAVGAVAVLILTARPDLSAVADLDLEWSRLLVVLPLYAGVVLVRGARIRSLVGRQESILRYGSVSAVHTFFTNVLPFRTGEFALPILLKKFGMAEFVKGSGVLVAVRLLDLVVLFTAMLLSGLLVDNSLVSGLGIWLGVGVAVCLLLLLAVIAAAVRGGASSVLEQLRLPAAFGSRLRNILTRLESALSIGPSSSGDAVVEPADSARRSSTARLFTAAFVWSVLSWALVFACFQLMLDWAGVRELTLPETILGSSGAIVAAFIPINTLMSLGTIEAGWAASLYLVGVEPATGVVVGFRLHVAVLLLNALFAVFGLLMLRCPGRFDRHSPSGPPCRTEVM